MYCLVENGVVTDGPRALPESWRNISGLKYANDAAWLATLGWLPFVPVAAPAIDQNTQSCVSTFIVNGSSVTQSWAIAPLDAPNLALRLSDAQSRAGARFRQRMNDLMIDEYIAAHPVKAAKYAAILAAKDVASIPDPSVG